MRILAAAVVGVLSVVPQQTTRFRSGVQVVPIYASVVGADGRRLTNLTVSEFTVFDNGVRQTITAFDSQPRPLVGVAMWDVSESLTPHRDRVRAAAVAFAEAMWPGDRFRFGTFGTEVVFSPHLTADKNLLRRIVKEEFWFGGPTPLWSTVEQGLTTIASETGERIMVVVSDGDANGVGSRKDLRVDIQRADIGLYAIGFAEAGFKNDLRDLADESGGGSALVKRGADLDTEFTSILEELHSRYLIGFTPAMLDGGEHKLEVRVTVRGARVRARRSYVAQGAAQ